MSTLFVDVPLLGLLACTAILIARMRDLWAAVMLFGINELAPYFAAMKRNLAAACAADPDVINLKATTTEQMGFEGREEGISAHAVVMLKRR